MYRSKELEYILIRIVTAVTSLMAINSINYALRNSISFGENYGTSKSPMYLVGVIP